MYRTIKYNNEHRHELDRFEGLAEAKKSADSLHHPDWPTGQGIKVVDENGHVLYDSASRANR